mmetsp:Transcript_73401/g.210734  ORF Transcript_73401/g.210734 Transcript_73401/m.210734 type:complete len:114 (-) Transcript_73401:361-702(-)
MPSSVLLIKHNAHTLNPSTALSVLVLVLVVLLMLMLSGVQTLTLLLGHRIYAIGRHYAVRQHSHHIPYALANFLYTRAGAAALAKSASTCIYTFFFMSSSSSFDVEEPISSLK